MDIDYTTVTEITQLGRFKTPVINGYKMRSGLEARVAETLNELNIPWTYEDSSYEYKTRVTNGICTKCGATEVYQRRSYTPDFFLFRGRVVLEVKGRFTGANRRTLKEVARHNEGLNLRLVFQSNNVYAKKTGRRYSDWAEQFGFKYYAGLKNFKLGMEELLNAI